MVANKDYLDPEYRDQINCILGDQFGSVEDKMIAINAERELVENQELQIIRQMELDANKAV